MKYLLTSLTLLFLLSFSVTHTQQGFTSVTFSTADQIKIDAALKYPSSEELSPAIILIHQGGSSKDEWIKLPLVEKLSKEGYAILAYDIRIHGKSGKDKGNIYDLYNNPERSPLDLVAALKFLKNDKRIDAKRIGVMGASIGGNLACVAATKMNVKSVVSISAKTSAAQNLSGLKEKITPNNAFYIASKNEQGGKRAEWANELYHRTKGNRKVEIGNGNLHGVHILKQNKHLEESIVKWFKKTL
jgi:dipeptidyl aminopeptidase/acylaminoacyl peptidase